MKGVIYTRVSSNEQVKGTSLESQEESCRKYCEQKGIEVVAVFTEKGESAKDLSLNNRKQLLAAMEFCRKKKNIIDAFIVLRVDRFARNTTDHFAVRKLLLDYGTTLHSVTETIGNAPSEKFMEAVLAAAAEYDNAIRKLKCSDGMSKKINQGIYPWKPPLGYRCGQFKKRGEKKTAADPLDEAVFPIIQSVLKEYAAGVHTQAELPRLLDQRGLHRARGRKTTSQLVDRILNRYLKFYAGTIANPWTGDEVKGLHVPMITEDELYRIQFIRSGRVKALKRDRYNPVFPLRRTVMCGACGHPLTGSTSHGNGGDYPHYFCHNKNCEMINKTIGKDVMEKEFIVYLERIAPKTSFLAVFKESVLDLWQEKGMRFEDAAQQYETQLSQLNTKLKTVYDLRENGTYSQEEFVERRSAAQNEIAAVKISLDETRIEQFDIEAALTYATNFARNLARQWLDLKPQIRPRFQKLVFPDGIPYTHGTGFGTAKLGCIFEMNQQFDADKSLVVDLGGIGPPTRQCECRVIPLYYRPLCFIWERF